MLWFVVSARFDDAEAPNANFQKASCVAAFFREAFLINASFCHSNLKLASFSSVNVIEVNYFGANLYGTKFPLTDITDKQLKSALSIQDALLHNGIRTHDKNLIINKGEPNCNISHLNGWILGNGNVTAEMSNSSKNYCNYTLQTISTGATIYQRVNLSSKWDSTLWPYSHAVLRANMGIHVSMGLKGINSIGQVLYQQTFSKFHPTCSNIRNNSFLHRFY